MGRIDCYLCAIWPLNKTLHGQLYDVNGQKLACDAIGIYFGSVPAIVINFHATMTDHRSATIVAFLSFLICIHFAY